MARDQEFSVSPLLKAGMKERFTAATKQQDARNSRLTLDNRMSSYPLGQPNKVYATIEPTEPEINLNDNYVSIGLWSKPDLGHV